MGWSIGYSIKHKRDIGYGVPAVCDHPDCNNAIDRGLSYVCGGEPHGGEYGCGLFFCPDHLHYFDEVDGDSDIDNKVCECCLHDKDEFQPKPDVPSWIVWKLNHESWQQWRDENPLEVEKMIVQLRNESTGIK